MAFGRVSGRWTDGLKPAVMHEAEEEWGASSHYGHSGRCVGRHFGLSNNTPSLNDLVFIARQWRRRVEGFSELLEASDHLRAAGQHAGVLRISSFNTKICKDSKLFEEEREGRYLRLRVENTGRTTIKDCSGHLQGIRTQIGSQVANLDSEVVPRGWANFDQKKRDIPPRAHFYMDVATLVLSLDRTSSELHWQEVPTTLVQYFRSIPGRATHTFEIRIDADNAHQRTVPAKFTFDPASSDLTSIIPFNTRYPGWRLRWWLRSRRSHRKWRPALCPVERRPHSDGPP
jgi:hypothetical protein